MHVNRVAKVKVIATWLACIVQVQTDLDAFKVKQQEA